MKERNAKGWLLPSLEECRILGRIAFETGDPEDGFSETIDTAERRAAWLEGWREARAET